MKLYGALASPYVARAALVARAKGLELPLMMPPGGLKSPEYLAINPIGRIPTLEDRGHHIAESTVICEYLDEVHTQRPLSPRDPLERAVGRLLARIVDLYVNPQTAGLFRNMNPATRNAADLETTAAALRKACEQLEHFMPGGAFAAGSSLTLADCILAPSFEMIQMIVPGLGLPSPFEGLPKLTRWWQTMHSDPLTAGFLKEYREALAAFVNSRRG